MRVRALVLAWVGCVAAPPPKPPAPTQPEVAPPAPQQEVPGPCDMADQVMRDTIGLMTEMTSVLESIVDETSAQIAVPRLEDLAERGQALKLRAITARDSLTDEENSALKRKWYEPMRVAAERLMQETMRVSGVAGAADALKAMRPRRSELH